jgi:uncharacterized protein YdbL (DUF1318 family)
MAVFSASFSLSLLAACSTMSGGFPAAAAQTSADATVYEVWRGSVLTEGAAPVASSANIKVNSPEARRLRGSMEARFPLLEPRLNAGLVGMTADGYVAMRDAANVTLSERNGVRALVANENADRAALYREIAQSNGQAQWESPIRAAFAARWIARAKSGWYYQDAGGAWLIK